MSTLKNKVQLIGNVGNAPEIKTLESGKKVANFSLATNEFYKNSKGEKEQNTQWHSIVAWGKVAGIVEELFTTEAMTDQHAFYGSGGDDAELQRRFTALMESCARFGAADGLDLVPTSRYTFALSTPEGSAEHL